jgi:hypothetical protein
VSFDNWLYINPEITIHLLRDPVDEWVLVDSGGYADGDGIGLAETRLEDRDGVIGRAAQSVLVDVLPEGASGQTA